MTRRRSCSRCSAWWHARAVASPAAGTPFDSSRRAPKARDSILCARPSCDAVPGGGRAERNARPLLRPQARSSGSSHRRLVRHRVAIDAERLGAPLFSLQLLDTVGSSTAHARPQPARGSLLGVLHAERSAIRAPGRCWARAGRGHRVVERGAGLGVARLASSALEQTAPRRRALARSVAAFDSGDRWGASRRATLGAELAAAAATGRRGSSPRRSSPGARVRQPRSEWAAACSSPARRARGRWPATLADRLLRAPWRGATRCRLGERARLPGGARRLRRGRLDEAAAAEAFRARCRPTTTSAYRAGARLPTSTLGERAARRRASSRRPATTWTRGAPRSPRRAAHARLPAQAGAAADLASPACSLARRGGFVEEAFGSPSDGAPASSRPAGAGGTLPGDRQSPDVVSPAFRRGRAAQAASRLRHIGRRAPRQPTALVDFVVACGAPTTLLSHAARGRALHRARIPPGRLAAGQIARFTALVSRTRSRQPRRARARLADPSSPSSARACHGW